MTPVTPDEYAKMFIKLYSRDPLAAKNLIDEMRDKIIELCSKSKHWDEVARILESVI